MKNYLERIATSAAHKKQRVHPFVGTLFQGAEREAIAEESLHIETIRTPLKAHSNLMPHVVTESKQQFQPHTPSQHEQLISRSQIDTEAKASQHQQPTESLSKYAGEAQSVADTNADLNDPSLETARSAMRTETGPILYEPLLVREAIKQQEESDGERVSDQMSLVRRSPISAQTAKQEVVQRRAGADINEDIQIHIGRIEVIAVQSPTQRTAAPTRKAMSLDEYLQRRDGRAR
jgi:hypothetical protein